MKDYLDKAKALGRRGAEAAGDLSRKGATAAGDLARKGAEVAGDLASSAGELAASGWEATSGWLEGGAGFVREQVGRLPFLGSSERSGEFGERAFDEKHYFLVPFAPSEVGYTVHTMRCLPEGVPPVNELPKRRVFHFPNEHGRAVMEELLLEEVRGAHAEVTAGEDATGSRLIDLADRLDRLDRKVFGGILLIGGIAALINPLAGAAIAAKAMIPSVGVLFSSLGLKHAGEKLNRREVRARVKAAEEEVQKSFVGADTAQLVNPLLAELELALRTDESEHDPMMEFAFEDADFGPHHRERFLGLTCKAVSRTYAEVLADRRRWTAARLGEEDVRWLQLVAAEADGEEEGK